ncbi:Flavodoxin domain protein [uncultured archaeon]|nr:Flavodoxin domain protein [uncultured archaeon]
MKTAIVCDSWQGNTEKVAKAMAEEIGAKLYRAGEAKPDEIAKYDLVGFGSGIAAGKPHGAIMGLIGKLGQMKGKKAFVFSTSGSGELKMHAALKEKATSMGFRVLGEFCCKGQFSSMKILFWEMKFKPTNPGKPDAADLENARKFAAGMKEAG